MIRSWFAYACNNTHCKRYKALHRDALAARRPHCVECGYLLKLARIITHNGPKAKTR